MACPVGTYSNTKGNGQLSQCKPCPINTFGNEFGQTSCQPCQGSTISDIGSTTCKCFGQNRNYLTKTGKCVCLSGFEPVDGSDASIDGISDCQKLVYQICTDDEERDVTGKCRKRDDCAKECDGGPGIIQQVFGICQCINIVTTDQICNADCRKNSLQTTFTSQGTIKVFDPLTKNTTETFLPNTLGQVKCSKQDATQCELVGVGMAQSSLGAFHGNYDLPPVITNASKQAAAFNTAAKLRRTTNQFKDSPIFAQNTGKNFSVQFQQVGRGLNETATLKKAQYISSPVICTTQGSAILWSDLNETIYPIYQKDNLLNTKSDFDFGAFTTLPIQLKGKTGQNFLFTFNDPGMFVFTDSRNPAKLMVVSVVADNHKCPTDSKFSPLTYASLLKVGAFQQSVWTPPNWAFFFVTLFSFVGLIVVAILLVSFILRRDCKMKKSPIILYQVSNYQKIERNDPDDVRSIVSINTDTSQFMLRVQSRDDGQDLGEKLEDRMKNKQGAKTGKSSKARTDLSLNQVEYLKDSLHKHLNEIKKLRALRFGKDGTQVHDELGAEASDYSSSDEDELNNAIENIKKMITNAKAVLKGETDDQTIIFSDDIKMIEVINTSADKLAEREEAIKIRKEQILENHRVQDEKFKRKIKNENEAAINNLDVLKNKVLEMQVNSAYDRGKAFQERMSRAGAKESELADMMTQLQSKMDRVEELLLDDKDRQNEMLKRNLESRQIRRRKLNEKLINVEEQLQKNEYLQADQKNSIVLQLQDELKQEIGELEEEDQIVRENLNKKFDQLKVERLADFQDRLRNAGGSKDFQSILEQFQLAQLQVDKELKRQIEKESDKLDRELKARKAQAKAAAEIRRNQKFKELEIEQSNKLTNQLDGKANIVEALTNTDRKDELMSAFTNRLKQELSNNNRLVSEMELERKQEEALRQEHDRKQQSIQVEAMKESTVLNNDVDDEIARLENQKTYEPFQALKNERSILQKQLQIVQTDQERDFLIRQLREVDDQVENQLESEAKDQDMALRRRLNARLLKREAAISRERVLKQSLIKERIQQALDNSTNYTVQKNDLTSEVFERIIGQIKLELTPEEIPSAIENLIDDKHQNELSDQLLKLYEQKAFELKEEILTMMEEKIARQQVLKKNFEDHKRGLDVILSRTEISALKDELQNRRNKLESEMLMEVNRLESEFIFAEQRKTREIQTRSMDRETKVLFEMSEMHFAEKKKIYEQYLPNSLMKDLYEEIGKREKEDMYRYQKEIETIKQARLKAMEEDDRQIQAELESHKNNLTKLTLQEAEVARREMLEARRLKQSQRTKQAVVSSQDVITRIREDLEKGLEGLSGAWEEEQKRQLALMQARLKGRDKLVQEALEQKKIQELLKAKQAEFEKNTEYKKVRECRKRKAQLLETIISGQQVIMESCYSRQLQHYNDRMHQLTVKSDEISNLLNSKSNELKKQVMSSLLQKVQNFEEKVSIDVKKPDRLNSKLTFANKLKLIRSGVNDDVTRQVSKDKKQSAKTILGNILKKKF